MKRMKYGDNFVTPVHDTVTFERSPQYMEIKLYSMLGSEISQISNVREFKNKCFPILSIKYNMMFKNISTINYVTEKNYG